YSYYSKLLETMSRNKAIVAFDNTQPNNNNNNKQSQKKVLKENKTNLNDLFKAMKQNKEPIFYRISPLKSNKESSQDERKRLTSWNFPKQITDYYHRKGIKEFFPWQIDCLDCPGVLEDGTNLVYSAPTSAGKTMVSDILLYKTLLERQKKAMIILPFVSITIEKVQSLKSLLRRLSIRIDSFAGNTNPRGGFARVDVAVCTIEKANNMINRMIEEDKLDQIGIVIVDELHMLGDPSRGYLLELLLSKLMFANQRKPESKIQIIGMSATIPNLPDIAKWLNAQLYVTEFRPVPLYERIICDQDMIQYENDELTPIKKIDLSGLSINQDEATLIYSAIETVIEGYSVLIFCPTKAMCEKVSRSIAENIFEFGSGRKKPTTERTESIGKSLIESIDAIKIQALLVNLKRTATGIDKNLELAVRFGVAFHHAGLSTEERSLIENAFRDGGIRILCSTTTLSAGVNLPARRVLISSPFDYRGSLLSVTCYRQMIGRAGRKGIDQLGESFIFCKEKEYQRTIDSLIRSQLAPIRSCLWKINGIDQQISMGESMKRALLEVIANGTATEYDHLAQYIRSTFLPELVTNLDSFVEEIVTYLIENQLLYRKESKLIISPLGKAIVASGVSPEEGRFIMKELEKARRKLSLINDLHLIYQLTPTYVADQIDTIDWNYYLSTIWSRLNVDDRSIAELVGVRESYLVSRVCQVNIAAQNLAQREKLLIHKRFYVALALNDLVREIPLTEVAARYRLSKGNIQSLQQQAATFAGMLSTFCGKLGWSSFEVLIEQFQPRLSFGVHRELIDLMRITFLTSTISRQLFSKGYETLISLIYCRPSEIEAALISSSVFQMDQNQQYNNNEENKENLKSTKIFLPNLNQHIPIDQLSSMIIQEARALVEADIGQKLYFDDQLEEGEEEEPKVKVDLELEQKESDVKEVEEEEQIKELSAPIQESEKPKMENQIVHRTSTPNRKSISNEHENSMVQNKSLSFMSLGDSLNDISSLLLKVEEEVEENRDNNNEPRETNQIDELVDHESELSQTQRLNLKRALSLTTSTNVIDCSQSSSPQQSFPDLVSEEENEIEQLILSLPPSQPLSEIEYFNTQNLLIPDSLSQTIVNNNAPLERLQMINVRNERQCRQLLEEIFPQYLVNETINIAIHYRIGPIISSFFNMPKKDNTKSTQQSQKTQNSQTINEEQGILLNHRTRHKLNQLYLARHGHSRIFVISTRRMFECLRESFNQWLIKLDPNFNDNNVKNIKELRFRFMTYDMKQTIHLLHDVFHIPLYSLRTRIDWHDLSIALWLLNPESKVFNISNVTIRDIDQMALQYKLANLIYLNQAQAIVARFDQDLLKTAILFHCCGQFAIKLCELKLYSAYKLIEIPVRLTLIEMEVHGIMIDYDRLTEDQSRILDQIQRLEAKIFQTVGSEFNLNNPEVVAKVLYQELNLLSNYYDVKKSGTKERTNVPKSFKTTSTCKLALIALQRACGVRTKLPTMIIEWRRLFHAINQSIQSIRNALSVGNENENDHNQQRSTMMIYCRCDEWSATGRILMFEPNLINISKRFETTTINSAEPIDLRRTVCARPGYTLVSADYAQLELRILAHFTNDKQLLTMLNDRSNDLFQSIAGRWKSIPINEVTDVLRQQAKKICYGIIYGMGDRTLAETLGVTESEATIFRNTFLQQFPNIDQWIEKIIDECIQMGYVETIAGRRRHLTQIWSDNTSERSKASRQAINSIIQGSAADLIKLAMISVDHRIRSTNIDASLVLQMYDELMFEVIDDDNNIRTFIQLLQQQMENVSKLLQVILPVKVRHGHDWASMIYYSFMNDIDCLLK
ncbi:hypothetical protein BLOT_012302, partial [Blomia tropicalis]